MSAIPTRRPGRGHPPHAIPPGDPHCPPQPLHRTLSSLPAHATCRSRAGSPCAPRAAPVQPVTARAARRPPHTPLAVAPRSPRRRAGSTPPPPLSVLLLYRTCGPEHGQSNQPARPTHPAPRSQLQFRTNDAYLFCHPCSVIFQTYILQYPYHITSTNTYGMGCCGRSFLKTASVYLMVMFLAVGLYLPIFCSSQQYRTISQRVPLTTTITADDTRGYCRR